MSKSNWHLNRFVVMEGFIKMQCSFSSELKVCSDWVSPKYLFVTQTIFIPQQRRHNKKNSAIARCSLAKSTQLTSAVWCLWIRSPLICRRTPSCCDRSAGGVRRRWTSLTITSPMYTVASFVKSILAYYHGCGSGCKSDANRDRV